jgi:hypothetical protein
MVNPNSVKKGMVKGSGKEATVLGKGNGEAEKEPLDGHYCVGLFFVLVE